MSRPLAWVVLTALAVASGVLALRLFPGAFPIVQLDLSMDRESALAAARDLATRAGIGPQDFREAASFTSDLEAQTFVELEGGGKDVYAQMLREGLYAAYTWRVRHFREGAKHEAVIRFRPDGRPDGFVEQLDETLPGAALTPEDARAIAERTAAAAWFVDLTPFALVEQSRERRPGGRLDHTFTYERATPTLNEGRYRLRLVVAGDRLVEVRHFIRIPQAFTRRYEEMRSANEAIGAAGAVALAVLYVGGGIGVGLFWLLRQRWVITRPAILCGVAVAALQLLAGINELPLSWMSYDTALPRASFITEQVTTLIAAFAGFSMFFGLSFMAAESLTRRAFGHHPQFWRVWSRDAASSAAVAGQTVAGYLLVAVFFAYDVLLYFYATRWFRWWMPSDALIHPDILATPLPWLSAIANSIQAGFWEEALFRAVPIAGAALIGDRFGHRRLFIVIAFVVQAIVFGAGHAPYPTQPSYARPVELILPSIAFGLIYLRFGLLPGIVLHYAFDVVWMALPLFVSTAADIWIDRGIVILLTFVPLWIVLIAKIRTGRWLALPAELRNSSWTPPPPREPASTAAEPIVVAPISVRLMRAWLAAGVAALLIWAAAQPFRSTVPSLAVSRTDAARLAREALTARGITLGPQWRIMPTIDDALSNAHRFVWEVGGPERFQALLGTYLPTPRWLVRVATFEGDVASRAEEWRILVNHRGDAERVAHQLAESTPGATLAEFDARARALGEIERVLHLPASSLREVSAQPSKLTARTDWMFTFEDLTVEPIPLGGNDNAATDARGEARIEVLIAGDEVARVRPFIRLPEAWLREQRARDTLSQIIGIFSRLIAGSALLTAAVTGVIAWSRRRGFARGIAVAVLGAFAAASLAGMLNRTPSAIASFSTATPFELQVAMLVGIGLLGVFLPGALVALSAGALPYDIPRRRLLTASQAAILGASLGALAAAAAWFSASGEPAWPDVRALGAYLPPVAWALDRVPALLLRTATLLALLTIVDDFTDGWTSRRVVFGILLIAAGGVLGVPTAGLSLAEWAPAAALTGLALLSAYVFLLRYDLSLTPLVVATMVVLDQIADGARTGLVIAIASSVVGGALTAFTGWWLFRLLRRARDGAEGDHQLTGMDQMAS
jgi:hypothetical protein